MHRHVVVIVCCTLVFLPPLLAFDHPRGADYGCPDNNYIYGEFIGIRKCYQRIENPRNIDPCNLTEACRGLHKDAEPVSIDSILEQEFLLTLVAPTTGSVLIGEHIPCGLDYSNTSFVKLDGNPLDTPISDFSENKSNVVLISDVTNGYKRTTTISSPLAEYIMCSITLPYCPFPSHPPMYENIITPETVCELDRPPDQFIKPVLPQID